MLNVVHEEFAYKLLSDWIASAFQSAGMRLFFDIVYSRISFYVSFFFCLKFITSIAF